MPFSFSRFARFGRKSLHDLGFDGIAVVLLFWISVPFARAYFYLRDITRGVHPMTGFKTPRVQLAFPFLTKR